MDSIGSLPAWVLVFFALIGFVWMVLLFCIPFFVYGVWVRAKEISGKMDTVIELLKKPVKPEAREINREYVVP